jgi:TonB family protein
LTSQQAAESNRKRRTSAAQWARRAGAALAVSAMVHVTMAFATGGFLWLSSRGEAQREDPVEIDVAPPAVISAEATASEGGSGSPLSPNPRPSAAQRTRTARVVTSTTSFAAHASAHRAPALLGLPVHEGLVQAHFTLGGDTIGTSVPITANHGFGGGGVQGSEVRAEGDVSFPARLLTSSALAYPPAARVAEIEVDLPLEIIVDVNGRVTWARALARAGYGLDEAALRAIRGYHFSPALRDGRAVAVRMRWMMQFRLR